MRASDRHRVVNGAVGRESKAVDRTPTSPARQLLPCRADWLHVHNDRVANKPESHDAMNIEKAAPHSALSYEPGAEELGRREGN